MYVRTPKALVWIDTHPDRLRLLPKAAPVHKYDERWAKKPLEAKLGRCLAVRSRAGEIELGLMINNRLVWTSQASSGISTRQLERWIAESF